MLNKAVGGINPDAVEWMHRTYGGRGKVVWLPTFDCRTKPIQPLFGAMMDGIDQLRIKFRLRDRVVVILTHVREGVCNLSGLDKRG